MLADTGWRRRLILGGGCVYAFGLVLFAVSPTVLVLLAAATVLFPASGSFVGLSQATLMDAAPARRERNMAWWTLAGSLGAVGGPLLLAGLVTLHLSWRPLFSGLALLTLLTVVVVASLRGPYGGGGEEHTVGDGMRGALRELRRWSVLRWLILLECSDLLLDVLLAYLGLYFVDVAGATTSQAAIAITIWTSAGLAGNLILLPVLRRWDGLRYLRSSALTAAILFPLLLLVPGLIPKLLVLGALALVNAGWYPVLKARLYGELPERSGTAMAVSTVSGTAGSVLPFLVGLVAQQTGLGTALWLLMAGPIAILFGLLRTPRVPL